MGRAYDGNTKQSHLNVTITSAWCSPFAVSETKSEADAEAGAGAVAVGIS